MLYSIKYRVSGQIFWRKLRGVKADGFAQSPFNPRLFFLASGAIVEIPSGGTEFAFPPERQLILDKMKAEKPDAGKPAEPVATQ